MVTAILVCGCFEAASSEEYYEAKSTRSDPSIISSATHEDIHTSTDSKQQACSLN